MREHSSWNDRPRTTRSSQANIPFMKTAEQLIAEAKARITEVTPQEVLDMQRNGEQVVLLDVRDLHEVNLGRIPGTVHISRGNLETKVEAQIPRDAHVVIYCATGRRSIFAADT